MCRLDGCFAIFRRCSMPHGQEALNSCSCAAAGLATPLNLAGDLLAWARDVDSGFEVPLP